jgi:hypothetical protein
MRVNIPITADEAKDMSEMARASKVSAALEASAVEATQDWLMRLRAIANHPDCPTNARAEINALIATVLRHMRHYNATNGGN